MNGIFGKKLIFLKNFLAAPTATGITFAEGLQCNRKLRMAH